MTKVSFKIVIGFVGLAIFIVINILITEDCSKMLNEFILPLKINYGRVEKKYRTKKDSPILTIVENKKTIDLLLLDYYDDGLWDAASVGDKVLKEHMTNQFMLITTRLDTLTFIITCE
jgi:hypothetical protein